MTTAERLYILQQRFEEDLKIEVIEWESEWNTTHYEYNIYIKSMLEKSLIKKDLKEFKEEGIVAFMSNGLVFKGNTLDEAVEGIFFYCHDEGLL